MNQSEMEPGFLQVFRTYAWLRAFSLLFIPSIQFHRPPDVPTQNLLLPAILAVADTAFLLVYLYWGMFRESLGRIYVPIALVFATLALIVEQHYFSAGRGFLQLEPFIYILLILTAWQYDFRAVILFTVFTSLEQAALNWFLPQQDILIQFIPDLPHTQRLVAFGFLAARSMTFLVVGYVVTRLVKAQRRQRAELAQTNRRLMQHAATVEQLTISRERNRLSRELHDTLAHTLSALTVQLEALLTAWNPIPDKPRQMLEQMLATTRSGLDETRRAMSALRASPLEEMGLALALRTLAEDFANRHAWKLDLQIPTKMDSLPAEVEQSLYRIAQEALENIARHANARCLQVILSRTENRLNLEIADDGRGFDMATVTDEQMGLRGMKERAEIIGAVLDIQSEPGKGTRLSVQVELEE
ncbi:MAG: sensor histidine kinase [Chloroflexota bacterium]